MAEHQIGRRAFLAAGALLGSAAVLPARLLARAAADDWPALREVLSAYAPTRLPGVAASVGRGTAAAHYLTAGTLARDSAVPVDADTLWRIYSMSKPITGIAAMMLIEDGKMTLDQNIADFIPAFASPRVLLDPTKGLDSRPARAPITVRNLLTHTAGLGYDLVTKGPLRAEYIRLGVTPERGRPLPPGDAPWPPTAPGLAVFAERLATLPLIADPGTKWSYSLALDLMGRVIEVVSGKSFEGFLQERLFGPLGMTSTGFQVRAADADRLVTNYTIKTGALIVADPGATSVFLTKPTVPSGGSGLVSSARDYDRFLLMLAGGGAIGRTRVMSEASVKLATSNLIPPGIDTAGTFAAGQGFGAGGQVITKRVAGGENVGSFGWSGAAGTTAWIDPVRAVRACGFGQFMPPTAVSYLQDLLNAVYVDVEKSG